jgi:hypothetical protein
LGEYSHLPNVPKPKDGNKKPLTSTQFADYPTSFYVVWIWEKGTASLVGTQKGEKLNFDVIEVENMKKDGARPSNEFVNQLLFKEGACRQYNFTY